MNRPITTYLLLIPAGYLAYCYYMDQQIKNKRIAASKVQKNDIKSLWSRYFKAKTAPQITNILKKTYIAVERDIVEPNQRRSRVVDCQVNDSGTGSIQSSWVFPYAAKTLLQVNKNLQMEKKKSGQYTLFFWLNLQTKQCLVPAQSTQELGLVREMIKERNIRCAQISEHELRSVKGDYQKSYLSCIRSTEGLIRRIDKELSSFDLMTHYSKEA